MVVRDDQELADLFQQDRIAQRSPQDHPTIAWLPYEPYRRGANAAGRKEAHPKWRTSLAYIQQPTTIAQPRKQHVPWGAALEIRIKLPEMPPRVTHVLFDAFGTLLLPRDPIHIQYARVARELCGWQVEDASVKSAFKTAFKSMADSPFYGKRKGLSPDQWWTAVIRRTFDAAGVPAQELEARGDLLAEALIKRFQSTEGYQLADGAADLLRSLHNQSITPCVASGSDRGIAEAIRSHELLGNGYGQIKEQDIWTTWDLELEKRDEAFWNEIVRQLGERSGAPVDRRSVLVVGDEYENDYLSAGRAGLSALLVSSTPSNAPPEHQIHRLSQVLEWLS